MKLDAILEILKIFLSPSNKLIQSKQLSQTCIYLFYLLKYK